MAASELTPEPPKVFISNLSGHSYAKAESFGELKWLTKGYVSFGSLDRLKFQLADKITAYTKKEDYLLLSGNGALCVFASLIWYQHHGVVKLLVHDKKNDDAYRVVMFSPDVLTSMFNLMGAGDGTGDNPKED
jgi:hypothetical protein